MNDPRMAVTILLASLLRQHRQALVVDLGKAAFDADGFRRGAIGFVDREVAVAYGRHEGCVAFQYAEVALCAGDDDHVHLFGPHELLWGDEFEVELACHVICPNLRGWLVG